MNDNNKYHTRSSIPKDDALVVVVDNHAIVQVGLQRSYEYGALQELPLAHQIFNVVAVRDLNDILFNDRTFVQFRRGVVGLAQRVRTI